MSTTLRPRGAECQVRITRNGLLDRTIVDIKSATITLAIAKKLEGFLGRSSEDVDDQFEHVEGNLVFQPRSQDCLLLARDIKLRSQRQLSQDLLKINLIIAMTFPNGQRPKIVVPDLKFGPIPLDISGRDQYVGMSFDWSAEDYDVLPT